MTLLLLWASNIVLLLADCSGHCTNSSLSSSTTLTHPLISTHRPMLLLMFGSNLIWTCCLLTPNWKPWSKAKEASSLLSSSVMLLWKCSGWLELQLELGMHQGCLLLLICGEFFFCSFGLLIVSVFVVNTGETDGFPQRQ